VTSTEIYTHVAITKLREVYDRTHPAAQLGRRREPDRPVNDPAAMIEEMLADDVDG
jgi:hypothetical protein